MVYTGEQIRKAEQNAVDLGMNWLRLMENAGSAVAKEIRNNHKLDSKKVVIVCGKGNNGGDGYVIARKLLENNAHIRVIAVEPAATQNTIEMASKTYSLGIRPVDFKEYVTLCCQYLSDADIIVDAIFGYGFNGVPDGLYADAINAINSSGAVKISVDIPSGISCDKGTVDHNIFVTADETITLAAYKPCHLLFPSCEYCGKVSLVSIGMPAESFHGIEPTMTVVSEKFVASKLPQRKINHHKGLSGTIGMFVGNKGYAGAAVLAGKAAIKSGAGIVNMIIPNSIYNIVGSSLHEAVCTVLNGDQNGCTHMNDTSDVLSALSKCTSGLLGCGLGQSYHTKHIISEILRNLDIPLVIDADGINAVSDCIDLIKQYKGDVIITPHPKEASRILSVSVDDIQNNRLNYAKKLAEVTGAVSVLKGAKTIIATPENKVYIVTDGNPGMATAGTGDMLAGMISSFLAQGMKSVDSAICGVKLHAMAGDLAVKETSVLSLTPTDMINILPQIYCRMYLKK
jgi:NAD(P)H-hydrate epimerase